MRNRSAPAALLTCALLAGCAAAKPELHGTQYKPPKPAPPISLASTGHERFTLASARGHVVLLYFGFTHCTDVCPQTLQHATHAIRASGVRGVRLVFVTVDPRRDTAAAERAFFERANVQAIGLTGSRTELTPIWKAYGVSVQAQPHDVAHSDFLYLIDPAGRLREVLDSGVSIRALTDDVRTLAS